VLTETWYLDHGYQHRNEIRKSTGCYNDLSVNILFTDVEICENSTESIEDRRIV
jgi:hypothetical protein